MSDKERTIVRRIVAISSVFAGAMTMIFGIHHAFAGELSLTWRWVDWPILASAVITLGMFVIMMRRVTIKRGPFYWFVILLAANLGLLAVLFFEASATTPAAEAFFQSLLTLCWIPIGPLILLFTVSLVDKREIPFQPITWAIFTAALGITVYISGVTNLVENHVPVDSRLASWGYVNAPTTNGWWVYAWAGLLSILSLVLLVRAYHRETVKTARRQLRVFIFAITQYMGLAFVVDIVLRRLVSEGIPPLSFLYITGMSLIIGYGVIRYGVFQLSPASLSDQILNDLTEGVLGVNSEFTVEFANLGARNIFGNALSDLRGKTVSSLFGKQTFKDLELMAKGEQQTYTLDNVKIVRGEDTVDAMLTVSKIFSGRPEPSGYIFVVQNVSELKKRTIELAREKASVERKVIERTRELHEERAKLHASIESLALGFALIGQDGSVIIQNRMLEELLQPQAPLQTADDIGRLMHGFALAKYCRATLEPDAPNITKEISHGEKVLRIFIASVLDEDHAPGALPIGSVMLVEDITEMKVLERSRDEFFSIASHELRTPLTAIRGNASMILEYYDDVAKNKDLQEVVEDIHASSVRLIAIVNDFLDLSRLEQKRMTFEYSACALDEIIESVVYEMKASIREKGINLKFDRMTLKEMPRVWVDPSRTKQVVYNLIGNAVKFTEEGGVSITSGVESDRVKIFVTDTGPGIPMESRKLLFHKFQQAGNSLLTRNTTRGTGLGLYISKLLVESMGGKVALEHSEEGQGTTFSFTLPIATPERIASHARKTEIDTKTGLSK